MTFVCSNPRLGVVDISTTTTIAPGNASLPSVTLSPQLGEVVTGWDPYLGGGEFIYLKGVASTAVGDVVSYNAYTGATTRWAGTANSGAPLAVAITANTSASSYGWYQIGGNAIANVSGTVAAGDIVNFASTATLKSAAAAGKQVLNAVAASANGATYGTGNSAVTLASTQAIYTLQRPFCQGAIT
jgi:hypothetical protein